MSNSLPDPDSVIRSSQDKSSQHQLDTQREPLKAESFGSEARAEGGAAGRLITSSTRVLTHEDLPAAVALFERAPGWEEYAKHFEADAKRFISDPPSAVYGVFREELLVGVGAIIREHWDFAYWAVSWVMIDVEMWEFNF
jgi:hypothetical protein